MSKAVLISIRPEWCEKIASGKKTIEVRKTRPKMNTPFKCYIYCTNSELLTRSHYDGRIYVSTSKKYKNALEESGNKTLSVRVIGEFVCDRIVDWPDEIAPPVPLKDCCMTYSEVRHYGGTAETLYLWHISELKIYDTPKKIGEFNHCGENYHFNPPVTRPPQSWCYVEELT